MVAFQEKTDQTEIRTAGTPRRARAYQFRRSVLSQRAIGEARYASVYVAALLPTVFAAVPAACFALSRAAGSAVSSAATRQRPRLGMLAPAASMNRIRRARRLLATLSPSKNHPAPQPSALCCRCHTR
jgi:hypothetical protein